MRKSYPFFLALGILCILLSGNAWAQYGDDDDYDSVGENSAEMPGGEERTRRPWGARFSSGISAGLDNLYYSDGRISQNNRLSATYGWRWVKLSLSGSYSGRYTFDENQQVSSAQYELRGPDLGVSLSERWRFKVADQNISARLGFKLPTRESARSPGLKGTLTGSLGTRLRLTRGLSLRYSLSPKYYIQTKRTNVEFDDFDRILNRPRPNKAASISNSLSASLRLIKGLSLSQGFGVEHEWSSGDPGVGVLEGEQITSLKFNTGLRYRMDSVSFRLGVRQTHDLEEGSKFSVYNVNETSFTFDVSMALGRTDGDSDGDGSGGGDGGDGNF